MAKSEFEVRWNNSRRYFYGRASAIAFAKPAGFLRAFFSGVLDI